MISGPVVKRAVSTGDIEDKDNKASKSLGYRKFIKRKPSLLSRFNISQLSLRKLSYQFNQTAPGKLHSGPLKKDSGDTNSQVGLPGSPKVDDSSDVSSIYSKIEEPHSLTIAAQQTFTQDCPSDFHSTQSSLSSWGTTFSSLQLVETIKEDLNSPSIATLSIRKLQSPHSPKLATIRSNMRHKQSIVSEVTYANYRIEEPGLTLSPRIACEDPGERPSPIGAEVGSSSKDSKMARKLKSASVSKVTPKKLFSNSPISQWFKSSHKRNSVCSDAWIEGREHFPDDIYASSYQKPEPLDFSRSKSDSALDRMFDEILYPSSTCFDAEARNWFPSELPAVQNSFHSYAGELCRRQSFLALKSSEETTPNSPIYENLPNPVKPLPSTNIPHDYIYNEINEEPVKQGSYECNQSSFGKLDFSILSKDVANSETERLETKFRGKCHSADSNMIRKSSFVADKLQCHNQHNPKSNLKQATSLDSIPSSLETASCIQSRQNKRRNSDAHSIIQSNPYCLPKGKDSKPKSPMSATKGRVKDLIQRFSSMESLSGKTPTGTKTSNQSSNSSFFKRSPENRSESDLSRVCLKQPVVEKGRNVCKNRRYSTITVIPEDQSWTEEVIDTSDPPNDAQETEDSPFTMMIKEAPILSSRNCLSPKTSRRSSINIPHSDVSSFSPVGREEPHPYFQRSYTRKTSPKREFCSLESVACSPSMNNLNQSTQPLFQNCKQSSIRRIKNSFAHMSFRSKKSSKYLCSSQLDSKDCEGPERRECSNKLKSYIQLKSLKSWKDAKISSKSDAPESFRRCTELVSSPTELEYSRGKFPSDGHNLRLSSKSEESSANKDWWFDPVCAADAPALLSQYEPVDDLDRSITYYSTFPARKVNLPDENPGISESSEETSLPFYSRMFRNSKKYLKRGPFSLEPKDDKSQSLNCLAQQRRHSLSNFSPEITTHESKKLTPSTLYPITVSPDLLSPPQQQRRALLQKSPSAPAAKAPSPPYFSTTHRGSLAFSSFR